MVFLSLSLSKYLIALYSPFFWGYPDSSVGKESAHNAGDPSSIPGLQRSPGEEKGYSLQYSGLENSMSMGSQRVSHMTE